MDAKWNFYRDIATLALSDRTNAVQPNEIIDLTTKMDGTGRLTWDAPAGNWTILRFGHTTTGMECHPAPRLSVGLECDKLDRQGVDAHFDGYIAKILENVGASGKSLREVLIDSYEVGDQNWSKSFRDEFKQRRGYDPVPWLVTATKREVGVPSMTYRFNYDWTRTISELFAENYYGYLAERVHRYPGLKLSFEPYEGPFNSVTAGTRADEPVAEFWQDPATWGWDSVKLVVSSAHIMGRNIVGAEAFTSQPQNSKWQQDPYSLKSAGDRAFCLGINQFMLHTFVHQPWTNAWPGMSPGYWGTHFGRTLTWWDQAAAWTAYLTRCQYLLQQFLKGMTVVDGRITLPSGMSYRVLLLPNREAMTPAVARKVRELVNAGATVMGPKPSSSPGLQDYPASDLEVKQIAHELWDSGKVVSGKTLANALADLKIKPDFQANAASVRWIHRKIGQTEVYFISNQEASERLIDCTFRIEGKQPELWDPATGEIREAGLFTNKDGLTTLPVKFDPRGSVFVVFRKPAPNLAVGKNWSEYQPLTEIVGPWQVRFDQRWGGPGQVAFDTLTDWTQRPEVGIRYYSGTAIYQKEFEAPETGKGSRLFLDLGAVKNLAEVWLNGKNLGVAWKPPFRVEATGALNPGKNKLEIRVVNLWPNRLIGDEQEPDDCVWGDRYKFPYLEPQVWIGQQLKEIPDWFAQGKPRPSAGRYTFTTWKYYTKDSPLVESGLLGPVSILVSNR